MPGRDVVIRSIETPDGTRCVDIVRRPDAAFGFAEYRRDAEDPGGWYPTGIGSQEPHATAEDALAAACRDVPWLGAVIG